ncbi:MAG: D-aminoacylase [Thermodesulfobacteriota bacterium]
MFDIVISNGNIIDGSGRLPYRGSIGIKGDMILKIDSGNSLSGKTIIDAGGMVVSPGFVDIHGHSDYFLLVNPQAESKVRQGVTTEIGGNCGYSAAPIFGEEAQERKVEYQKQFSLDLNWYTVQEYSELLKRIGISMNFAILLGHNTIRASVMGKENRNPGKKELEDMCIAVEKGMKEGAFGLSTGLIYSPACFSEIAEIVALNNVVKRYKGVFTTHMRSEDDMVVEAINEVIEVARKADVPLQISHLKTSRERNWNKLDRMFKVIESAIDEGLDVTCDRYPYIASNTGLQAILPDWTTEGDKETRISRLKDQAVREKIENEIVKKHPEPDYWKTIVISTVVSDKNNKYQGMSIADAAGMAGKEPFDFTMDVLIEEEMNVSANYFTMSEENLVKIYRKPYIMIGSDAACRADYGPLAEGSPHPRAFGTFPRVLGVYVREKKIMDLPTAVKKMTSDPCRKLGIQKRGELREGFYADLVIFNPDTIVDKATFSEPVQYPEGIEYVIVNGNIAVKKGEHTGCKNGRVLRKT